MATIDEHIRLASDWGSAMKEGNADKANLLFDRIQKLFEEICKGGRESELFDRADQIGDEICLFIASHLMNQDKSGAIALYRRLERSTKPYVAISAKYILNELYRPTGSARSDV